MDAEVWKNRLAAYEKWSEDDKKLFTSFAKDATLHQIGNRRIVKYRTDLAILTDASGKGLVPMLKNLNETISSLNASKSYEPVTKKDCKRTLGSIWSFWKTGERSLKYLDRKTRELFAHKIKAGDKRLAREIITREEIRELSKRGDIAERAIIWLLFESGMRCGEFEKVKKSDIGQIKEGLNVRVPQGKTGERKVVVVEATKYVNAWLDAHPSKREDAPLWLSRKTGQVLGQAAITKRLRVLKARLNAYRKKEGIPAFNKDVNPHNFRHSRASELGGEAGMTEAIMCRYFGWEIGSDMPRTYLHLTEEQVKAAVLRTYGKAKKEEEKKIETSWLCPRCKEDNPLGKNYCGRCGSSQEGKVISETEKLREEIAELRGAFAGKYKEKMRKGMYKGMMRKKVKP